MSIISVIAIALGAIVCAGSLVCLVREHHDSESVKIYGIAAGIAAVIAILGGTGIIA